MSALPHRAALPELVCVAEAGVKPCACAQVYAQAPCRDGRDLGIEKLEPLGSARHSRDCAHLNVCEGSKGPDGDRSAPPQEANYLQLWTRSEFHRFHWQARYGIEGVGVFDRPGLSDCSFGRVISIKRGPAWLASRCLRLLQQRCEDVVQHYRRGRTSARLSPLAFEPTAARLPFPVDAGARGQCVLDRFRPEVAISAPQPD